jgi:protein-S-isoprenylcysteine O-methyltransferase Ste14
MDRRELIELWGYDPAEDVEKLNRTQAWLADQHAVVRVALLIAAALVALAAADLTPWSVPDHIANDRQIALLVVAETVLLVLVFWVVDAAADRRSRRQWEQTTGPVIASLRLNMLLTQQRLDHAVRHTDDDISWTALAQSSEWFLRHVQTSQPLLVVHPELAGLAPKFMMIATRLADRAGALARIVHEWRERLVVGGVGHVGRGVSVPWR